MPEYVFMRKRGRMESADFKEGVILPDGGYLPMKEGHLHTLMNVTGIPEAKLWEMIPKDDSPLFWLIAYTGCVITDLNSSVGMKMTEAQRATYDSLVTRGIITDKYYDITEERKKRAELEKQRAAE